MTSKILGTLCLWLAVASLVSAGEAVPDQRIVGAERPIPLGELVDLGLSPLKEKITDLEATSVVWKVVDLTTGQEKRVREYEGGIFFGAGITPRRLKAFAAVSYLFIKRDTDKKIQDVVLKTAFLSADIIIGDEPAPPPPPPGPNPPSPPVPVPDGKYKLSKLVYDAAQKVSSPDRATAAKALAGSFRGIASAIAAGTIKTDKDILEKTKAANDSALKANGGTKPWEGWSDILKERLYELYTSKQFTSLDHWREAWLEISLGLEAVR